MEEYKRREAKCRTVRRPRSFSALLQLLQEQVCTLSCQGHSPHSLLLLSLDFKQIEQNGHNAVRRLIASHIHGDINLLHLARHDVMRCDGI
jgi:hypothetical protein